MRRYITDPQEVYTLELEKFQRCFSELTRVGEEISELNTSHWRQVEQIRQFNFILQEAIQIGEILTSAL